MSSAQEESGPASGPGNAVEDDWVALQALLLQRDQAFRSAYLPYTVDSIDSPPGYGPAKTLPAGPAPTSVIETGWWLMDGDRYAFQREYVHCGAVSRVHFTWDTARASILHVQPALLDHPEAASEQYQFPSLLTIHEHPGQPARSDVRYFPDQFGLIFNGERWTDWAKATADKRVLGREDVNGVDCLAVLLDVVGPGNEDDGEYVAPSIVWFDDQQTLLARRRVAFRYDPEKDSQAPRLGPSRVFGERRFRPVSCWTLLDTRQVNGAWLPAAGEYRLATPHGDWKVSVRVGEGATFNGDVPAGCFEIKPPPGTTLIDYVEGRREKLSVGPAGDRENALREQRRQVIEENWRELARITTEERKPKAHARITRLADADLEAFDVASCGPSALFVLLAHLGISRPLSEISQALPPSHRVVGKTNLNTLRSLAASCVRAIAVHSEAGDPAGWPPIPFVAHESHLDHEHFTLACVLPDGHERAGDVWLWSPPSGPTMVKMHEFRQRWSGAALLVGDEACSWFEGERRFHVLGRAGLLLGGFLLLVWSAWKVVRVNREARGAASVTQ